MAEPITWRHDRRRLADLVPWEHNPRIIKKEDAKRLLDSLGEFGQIHAIAIGPENQIYDGHQRDAVWAANEKYGPDYQVDVRIASRALTHRERSKLVVYLHQGATGEFDFDGLANLPDVDLEDLVDWGFDKKELVGSGVFDGEELTDAEPQVDRAEELLKIWKVQPGQIWTLGDHRLMCEDCSNLEQLRELMGGQLADMVFTSPPYNMGVNYRTTQEWVWDWPKYEQFLKDCLGPIVSSLAEGRALLWNIGTFPKTFHARQHLILEGFGLTYYRQVVWKKVGVSVPMWHNTIKKPLARHFTPNYQHELVLVFTKGELEPGDPIEPDPLCANDVFEFLQALSSVDLPAGPERTGAQSNLTRRSRKAHPAPFPVRIPKMFVTHFTAKGETVLEPFSGSGSTLIACENLERKCRAMEIDPGYVAVTLQRWADATGQTPQLVQQEAVAA